MSKLVIKLSIISVFVGIVIGFWKGKQWAYGPVKIGFKPSPYYLFLGIFLLYFMLSIGMAGEYLLNQYQMSHFYPSNLFEYMAQIACDSGILVVILLPFVSWLWAKRMERMDLDLSGNYSEKIVKIYCSLGIVINFICFIAVIKPYITIDNLEIRGMLTRLFIWLAGVIGTWYSVGSGCKGRISEERNNIKVSERKKNPKERNIFIISGVSSVIVYCVCCFVIITDARWMKDVFVTGYFIMLSLFLGMAISLIMVLNSKYPTERRSCKKLAKAIAKTSIGIDVTEQFQYVTYTLMAREEKYYIKIHKRDIIWEGCEKEDYTCFDEDCELMEILAYEACRKYLKDKNEQRKLFLEKKENECKENCRKRLIEES